MNITTIVYLILAALLSLLVAFFQYFYKEKMQTVRRIVLFTLKFLSFFLLLVLLINPKIKLNTTENSKPILAVLKDKSSSINYFKSEQALEEVRQEIQSP